MKLFLPATALSVPILAHSHLSRGYHPTNLQRSQAAIAIYIFNRLFFQRTLGVCYHQFHVSDPLHLLNDVTDFYEILKHHEHYSNAGHRTIVAPNFQFQITKTLWPCKSMNGSYPTVSQRLAINFGGSHISI